MVCLHIVSTTLSFMLVIVVGTVQSLQNISDSSILASSFSSREKRSVPRGPDHEHHIKRRSVRMMVLPADESLLKGFSSEKVEEKLGHARIERRFRIRRNQKVDGNGTHSNTSLTEDESNEARVKDLEQIFGILAKRRGFLLEQMLSLRVAIDKVYYIFEQMGLSTMPRKERDEIIRNILKTSVETYGSRGKENKV